MDQNSSTSESRHIELSVVKSTTDSVEFKIIKQTHRNAEFSKQNNTSRFIASNNFKLVSYDHPMMNEAVQMLYCRGDEKALNDKILTCSKENFWKICEAITEYNETDGKGYRKPWPQVGDKYFCIEELGYVNCYTFTNHEADYRRKEFGNMFKTETEAKVAEKMIKSFLKSIGTK